MRLGSGAFLELRLCSSWLPHCPASMRPGAARGTRRAQRRRARRRGQLPPHQRASLTGAAPGVGGVVPWRVWLLVKGQIVTRMDRFLRSRSKQNTSPPSPRILVSRPISEMGSNRRTLQATGPLQNRALLDTIGLAVYTRHQDECTCCRGVRAGEVHRAHSVTRYGAISQKPLPGARKRAGPARQHPAVILTPTDVIQT